MSGIKYRADIDGLRAVAVLAVLVFHFFPQTLDVGFRGYLGVDIFFVISGFLISKYIVAGLSAGTFRFKEFYWRRVKRILPAAFVTLALASVAAIVLLTPYDLAAYFKSQLAALSFTPNIYFWRSGGYFGDLDALKPLLHYWSLGVEEQFYLVFPLTLFLAYRALGLKWLLPVVALISAGSFLLNVFLLNIGGANPAFFLLPTRVWQFGLGCLAALMTRNRDVSATPAITNGVLVALCVSLFAMPPDPIPEGLLPSFFTAVLLGLLPANSFGLQVLSNGTARFFGRISFSLYLLHWPIVVFLSYVFVDAVPVVLTLGAIVATVLASHLSYRFVETPFRHGLSARAVAGFLVAIALVLLGLSLLGLRSGGLGVGNAALVAKLSDQVQTNYRCPITAYKRFGGSRACVLTGQYDLPNVTTVLVGNSHAQMYAPLVAQRVAVENSILVPLNGCLPTTGVNISAACLTRAKKNAAAIDALPALSTVVIGMTWYADSYVSADGAATRADLLRDLLAMVERYEAHGVRVFVISPIPTPGYHHASVYSRKLKFGQVTQQEYLDRSQRPFAPFYASVQLFDEALKQKLGSRYINVYRGLCDATNCYFGDTGGSFFADSNHLSRYGLTRMQSAFDALSDR